MIRSNYESLNSINDKPGATEYSTIKQLFALEILLLVFDNSTPDGKTLIMHIQ
jgi:hypothetical protein